MAGIGQYLKDTRAELRHVAWPTQAQTIIYTVLVAAIALGVAAYLGLFDFLFTTGLTDLVNVLPAQNSAVQTQTTTVSTSTTSSGTAPTFTVEPAVSTPTNTTQPTQ